MKDGSGRIGRRAALAATAAAALSGCGFRFRNPGVPLSESPALTVYTGPTPDAAPWPEGVRAPPPSPVAERVHGARLRVTIVNHATVLIQTHGLNILTDPIWSDRASPLPFAGPRRHVPPGIPFGALPPIDAVLVSHDHYDHLDLPTLARLWRRDRPVVAAGLGNGATISRAGAETAELGWGDGVDLGQGVRASFLPALHWSARGPLERQSTLWGAFAIGTPSGGIYFAGDTAFGTGGHFRDAARTHGPFRLALLPIGAYAPRALTRRQHIDPYEAVRAHRLLNARHSLAIHHGTFRLTDEGRGRPARDLAAAMARLGVSSGAFRALPNGVAWDVPAGAGA